MSPLPDDSKSRASTGRAICALLCIVSVAVGCGEDAADGDSRGAIDAQVSATCLDDTPEFIATPEDGMIARGKNETVQARVIAADPAMPERFENDWIVRFTDAANVPLDDVEIVDACVFMPVHGHGGVPRNVGEAGEPGTFELKGLNLFMRGPWEVQLAVNTARGASSSAEATSCDRDRSKTGRDLVLFRVCVRDD